MLRNIYKTLNNNNKKDIFNFVQKYSFGSSNVNLQYKAPISFDVLSNNLKNMRYAVRGAVIDKALDIEQKMAEGEKYNFDKIIYCNIGNPQQLKQKPITFHRQVLSLVETPSLIDSVRDVLPSDVIERAEFYLKHIEGGTGAYTHSQGAPVVREEAAQYISQRDGFESSPNDIFLTNGASAGVELLLGGLITSKQDGVMIPIPQYPLYSALIPLHGGSPVKYYLEEETGWSLNIDELNNSYKAAINEGVTPKSIVIINPGNPTGTCLPKNNIRDIVHFCNENSLAIMADEVYQDNIYSDIPFTSFKKVVREEQAKDNSLSDLQLISFHSVSKGFLGECGKRGGYFETVGVPEDVKAEFYKQASVSLCSNVTGMIMMGLSCNPPKPGDPSYELYIHEKKEILDSLNRRSKTLVNALNSMDGVDCQDVTGALYAFPKITLPQGAYDEAKKQGIEPDLLYCLELVEDAGICVVPGSGFGQKDGTLHFRTTFLPPEDQIDQFVSQIKSFHDSFLKKYSN